VGDTVEELEEQIREATQFHIEGRKEDGLAGPDPTSRAEYVIA
jgi:predicted RNase H-like HicB family nuclease